MKVILLEDIKKKGKKGDILTVKDGYGNFLISSNQAVIASKENVNDLNRSNEKRKIQEQEDIKECEKIKLHLEKQENAIKTSIKNSKNSLKK